MAGNRPLLHEHKVTAEEKLEEQMFLGLRKTAGVTHHEFKQKFGQSMTTFYEEVMKQLQQDQLLEVDNDGIRLARHGRFVGNEVFQRFLME